MAGDLTLRIITPERILLDERVSSVRIPGLDGSIGILPRHATMVSALATGLLLYRGIGGGGESAIFVANGFAEVRDDTVRVVCDAGERPEDIDVERAELARERARKRLEEAPEVPEIDILRAEMALIRAQQRLLAQRGYARTLV